MGDARCVSRQAAPRYNVGEMGKAPNLAVGGESDQNGI